MTRRVRFLGTTSSMTSFIATGCMCGVLRLGPMMKTDAGQGAKAGKLIRGKEPHIG